MSRKLLLLALWPFALALCSGLAAHGQDDPEPGDSQGSEEPALPIGLGGPEEPDLPPGLGEDEPGLPPGLAGDGLAEDGPADTESPAAAKAQPWHNKLRLSWENRFGTRLGNDPAQREDLTLLESRLQVEGEKAWKRSALDLRLDLLADGLESGLDTDLRQLRWTLRPTESLDVQIGRQILTWGTGDLVFINDLFPKDWQAFLLGRRIEYLKAPSDALRVGWFSARVNVELVYTPRFDPDRFLTGERLSFFDPLRAGSRGAEDPVRTRLPDRWFEDDEIALRMSDEIGSLELAIYGYRGYWKSPAGFDPAAERATFPKLDVFGASLRGPWGRGIANIEVGYYDSREDRNGSDPSIGNSELRGLIGYELELGRELTGGAQLYVEQLLDYGAYRRSLPVGVLPRDQTRVLTTFRLTKLLRSQTVVLSLFAFLSPTDEDAYLRPRLEVDLDDHWSFEVGGNVFLGRQEHTFFGQFEDNSSLFTAWRYSR